MIHFLYFIYKLFPTIDQLPLLENRTVKSEEALNEQKLVLLFYNKTAFIPPMAEHINTSFLRIKSAKVHSNSY